MPRSMKDWLPAIMALALALGSAALSQVLPDHSTALLGSPRPQNDWLEEWVPRAIGDWTAESRAIDTDVLVTAGVVHYLARKYTNPATGQAVDVLLVYGDPVRIHQHTHELCDPAARYERTGLPRTALMRIGSSIAGFAVNEFKGCGPGASGNLTVWCGCRDDTGHWIPTLKRRQVARVQGEWRLMVSSLWPLPMESGGHARTACEAFLQVALPELEPIVAGVPPEQTAGDLEQGPEANSLQALRDY